MKNEASGAVLITGTLTFHTADSGFAASLAWGGDVQTGFPQTLQLQ